MSDFARERSLSPKKKLSAQNETPRDALDPDLSGRQTGPVLRGTPDRPAFRPWPCVPGRVSLLCCAGPTCSSRKVTVDGSNRMKPDISAPGSSIRSSYPGGGYASLSGTSMAGPHVAGLVALLISGQPALRGQVDEIEDLIRQRSAPNAYGAPRNHVMPNTASAANMANAASRYGR